MHDIPMSEVTPEFARCWQAAGMHIERGGWSAQRLVEGASEPSFPRTPVVSIGKPALLRESRG